VPSALPLADPAPLDGLLPAGVVDAAGSRNFGVYVHVPFCKVRCGYCDFNTYTSTELRGAKREDYAAQATAEVGFAAEVLAAAGLPDRMVSTVFFGGGTPTLLPAAQLESILAAIAREWPLAPGAEVTTEANPDSVDLAYLNALKAAGFTRVSFGMQSAVPQVLATLERTHDPARIPLVVAWAREAGLDVSLDLIYGTPGESLDDWRASLDHAIACAPDHISAYALIIEDGTKLAAQIKRVVRSVELEPRRRPRVGPQPRVLARARLVGDRPRRAQSCRRSAVVERQASRCVRREDCRRTLPGRGARVARRGNAQS
jgi:coproporphyrinogen III oxidase-like Fe-S oxidoreductase